MRTAKKKAVIAAVRLLAAGLLISLIALAALDFNIFEMGTMEAVTNVHEVTDGFSNIRVWGSECGVRLLPSEDGTCRVVCRETDRITHTVAVKNGTLMIERTDDRRWYEGIGIMWRYWGPIEVEVYLPERAYTDLSVRTVSGAVEVSAGVSFADAEVDGTSGDVRFAAAVKGNLSVKTVSGAIRVEGTSPENLTLRSTSGHVTAESIRVGAELACKTVSGDQRISDALCRSAALSATSGTVVLSDLLASETVRVENVSGGVKLTGCDADALWIKTVSGSVTGSLRTDKVFDTSTTSGSVRVPDSAAGGACEVHTVSGDIRFDAPDR